MTLDEREAIQAVKDAAWLSKFTRCPKCRTLYLPENGHTAKKCEESGRTLAELKSVGQ